MAARDEQQQIGELKIGLAQHRRQCVPLEMIDRDQRLSASQREPLGRQKADHHAADQARPRSRGDRIDLGEIDLRFRKHLLDQAWQDLDMGARGDLRHDPAERPVRRFLPGEAVGEDAPVGGDQRRRRLVAARFDAEDQAHRCFPATRRASSTSAA